MDRRTRLVREVARSVSDRRVLEAIGSVPRELFVATEYVEEAYADIPLPIGLGQTISQPSMVAIMLEALELDGTEHVLEVGAGSGYQAALLSRLCRSVVSTEVLPELVERARRSLASVGAENVEVVLTTEGLGAPDRGPYDAIVVAAAAPRIPTALVDQLEVGGRMAIPVGPPEGQDLMIVRRTDDGFTVDRRGGCRFVPLVGPYGYGGAR